jgi:hypothetical protein
MDNILRCGLLALRERPIRLRDRIPINRFQSSRGLNREPKKLRIKVFEVFLINEKLSKSSKMFSKMSKNSKSFKNFQKLSKSLNKFSKKLKKVLEKLKIASNKLIKILSSAIMS